MRFAKMHGLGNDFVLLDGVSQPPPALSPANIRQLSHRRLGIGFDQLLLLQPAQDAGSDFYCRIYNADGGEVGQCGNGVRCAHAFLLHIGLTDKQQLVLSTATTRLSTRTLPQGEVRVELPPAKKHPPKQAMGYEFFHIEVGNPHYVCLDAGGITDDALITVGEQLNASVEGGVNVGFAEVEKDGIKLRVFERGAGLTAACGSGALAAALAAVDAGKAASPVRVTMPGGKLSCGVNADGTPWLEGSVTHVFEGELSPSFSGAA